MKKKFPGILFVPLILLTLIQCAKRGMPEGGPIDEEPPKFIRANPENYTTNFDSEEIRIYFDEYIKLDKPQQQIIISPPMDPKPDIMPLGSARKDIRIEIFDTLEENTTYAINFGKSIVDNNEGNPFNYFKYVFSTGEYIDSLEVKGTVKDASLKAPKEPISVMLYEVDSTYTDSIVFKETPRYITYSQDSTFTFSLENLKKGTYRMVGIMDNNDNYLYNPKTEKIGFIEGNIEVPTDSTFQITVFKEELQFSPSRPTHFKGNQILFGYEGSPDLDSLKIELLNPKPEAYVSRIVKDAEKDSLYYWYNKRPESDSLSFLVSTPTTKDTLIARLGTLDRDSLNVTTESGSIKEDFKFKANTPIVAYREELVRIIDQDSAEVPFTAVFDSLRNEIRLKFDKTPSNRYQVSAFPGAITDIFEETNDTIVQKTSTSALADFGTIMLNLQNIDEYPIIVQLTDTKGKILSEQYAEEAGSINFNFLKPGDYLVRVIFDSNSNRKWDTGDYLKKRQPEVIKYYRDTLNVRANFDYNEILSVE